MLKRLVLLSTFLVTLVGAPVFAASIVVSGQGSTFEIHLNEGFDDPVHGADRQAVFVAAAQVWADILVSPVTIDVDAAFTELYCSSSSATLGSAGPAFSIYYSSGAESFGLQNNTFYPVALFNARTGRDIDDQVSDINASFNGNLDDNSSCLNGVNWYYGLDHNPPGQDIDFFEVVLHELAHGLGVVSLVGSNGSEPSGLDDAFSRWLKDKSTGELWSGMTDSERLHSMTDTGDLVWAGPSVTTLASELAEGVNGGEVQMYAPSSYQSGSSVSHFDTALTPNELMEPQHTGGASYEHTIALLNDIGWEIVENDAPVITGQQTLTVAEDQSLLLSVNDFIVADSDHSYPNDFSLTVMSGNDYTVSGNRVIPVANFVGDLSVDVQISDGIEVSSLFPARVSVTPVNDAPVLSGNPEQSVMLNEAYRAMVFGSDIDSDPLTYTLTSDHSWLSIDQDGELSGTPGTGDIGTAEVRVTVSDGALQDTLTYPLTVQDAQSANLSVQLNLGQPLLSLNQTSTVLLTVTNQGPAVSASGTVTVTLPAGLSLSDWDPNCAKLSSRDVSCSVSGLTGSATFSLVVFGTQSITGDIRVSVSGDQTDPNDLDDTDRLTLIVSNSVISPTADITLESDVDVLSASSQPSLRVDGRAWVELATAGDHLQKRLDTERMTSTTVLTRANNATTFAVWNTDLDRNAQRDLIFAQAEHLELYRNGATSAQQFAGPGIQNLLMTDVNGDDYPDMVLAMDGPNELYLNDQQGGFALHQTLGSADSRALAVMDANEDGWPDLLVANDGQADQLYLNLSADNGSGVFDVVGTAFGAVGSHSRSMVVGDFNGDGKSLEIVVGRNSDAVNASVERFEVVNGTLSSLQSFQAGDILSMAVGDRDDDGQDELLLLNEQGVVQLWGWHGGELAAIELYQQAGATSVMLTPLDADERADQLITARAGHPSVVYFSPSEQTPPPPTTQPAPSDGLNDDSTRLDPGQKSPVKSGTFGGFGLLLGGLLLVLLRRR